jgi:hypothetical protein
MDDNTKQTVSVWMDTGPLVEKAPLTESVQADVCIVGAGISGMTTAYLLSKEAKRVIVLDDGPIGGGMTGRTTAHLVNALDDRYFELERLHGWRLRVTPQLLIVSNPLLRSSKSIVNLNVLMATCLFLQTTQSKSWTMN